MSKMLLNAEDESGLLRLNYHIVSLYETVLIEYRTGRKLD